jgi:hypothetical protein
LGTLIFLLTKDAADGYYESPASAVGQRRQLSNFRRSYFGGVGFSSLSGEGSFNPKDKQQVLKDEYGLKTSRAKAESLLALTRIIKRGMQG